MCNKRLKAKQNKQKSKFLTFIIAKIYAFIIMATILKIKILSQKVLKWGLLKNHLKLTQNNIKWNYLLH